MDTALQRRRDEQAGVPVRAVLCVIALSLVMSACSSAKPETAADGETVTMDKLYAIAKSGNQVEFEMAWASMTGTKDPNAPDPKTGQTLLHYAAENRTSPLMTPIVLNTGADPNLKDGSGLTALRHAIMANNQVAIRNMVIRSAARLTPEQLARTVPVKLDVAGPDGKTDQEACQAIIDSGQTHRGCQVMFEVLNGATRSTPEQLPGVLRDLDQAKRDQALQ